MRPMKPATISTPRPAILPSATVTMRRLPSGRPSQNPADVRGKILRVDASATIIHPIPTRISPSRCRIQFYIQCGPCQFTAHGNQPHRGHNVAVPALGEVYVTGVRNGYRMSFDRANSDMYWGDVGEFIYEEVDFSKRAATLAARPLITAGLNLKPPTAAGSRRAVTNPFTGVISLYPLREYSHSIGQAAIGGYVYHGPIPELQGKYFYSDFAAGKSGCSTLTATPIRARSRAQTAFSPTSLRSGTRSS